MMREEKAAQRVKNRDSGFTETLLIKRGLLGVDQSWLIRGKPDWGDREGGMRATFRVTELAAQESLSSPER